MFNNQYFGKSVRGLNKGVYGTLVQKVPDYISLGYDIQNTEMKVKGAPIALNLDIRKITKKTLSIFWAFKNKNLYKVSGSTAIIRDKSFGTKAEQTLLRILRNIDTLTELSMMISEDRKVSSYGFKNLNQSRKEQILDAVWDTNGTDGSLVDLKSLQNVEDSISYLK